MKVVICKCNPEFLHKKVKIYNPIIKGSIDAEFEDLNIIKIQFDKKCFSADAPALGY